MKGIVAIISLCTAVFGCAAVPIPAKGIAIVKAIPKLSEDTDWYRDYCNNGEPTDSAKVPYGDSCGPNQILHHAELNRVKLINVFNVSGAYHGKVFAAMSGGKRVYWNPMNTKFGHFILQHAQPDFASDTGADFLMTPVFYDLDGDCVGSFGFYPHADARNCPDLAFHEQDYDACIPVDEVLRHFNNG